MLNLMKDKKTIAIVTLAAITAGFAIFSFVNNTSKHNANSKLKAENADQLDEKVLTQDEMISELNKAVKVKEEEMSALKGQVAEKTSEIESMNLQHAQDLGEVEAKLKVTTENLETVQGELKVQTDIATAKAKEARERGETVLKMEEEQAARAVRVSAPGGAPRRQRDERLAARGSRSP